MRSFSHWRPPPLVFTTVVSGLTPVAPSRLGLCEEMQRSRHAGSAARAEMHSVDLRYVRNRQQHSTRLARSKAGLRLKLPTTASRIRRITFHCL